MVCGQGERENLEEISEHFNMGHLSEETFFALRKIKLGIALEQEELTSLDKALEYINLIEKGHQLNQELKESGTVNTWNQNQYEAFNLYLQFAREKKVTDTDIPNSIKRIKETIEKGRNKGSAEKEELGYAESLFYYLLRYSLTRIERKLGYA